jgi:hypothetical protein
VIARRVVGGAAAILFLVVACGRSEPRAVGTTTVTSSRIAASDEAVMWLTTTRCDREVACGNVGRGRTFVDRTACNQERGRDTAAMLRSDLCPKVKEDKLTDCWLSLRHERCDTPIPSLGAIDSCRREALCATTNPL